MNTSRYVLWTSIFCITLLLFSCTEHDENLNDPSKIEDGSGNKYSFVSIGNQDWLTENLKSTKFNNGNDIPSVVDSAEWANLDAPAYCWYENDEANYGKTYGILYNWYTVKTENLCPIGWHTPSDEEWSTLVEYLGGENIAGAILKEADTTHWNSPNTGATNEFGFSSLPGGQRFTNEQIVAFWGIKNYTVWWSSTERSSDVAIVRGSNFNSTNLWRSSRAKKAGLYVRCVRD